MPHEETKAESGFLDYSRAEYKAPIKNLKSRRGKTKTTDEENCKKYNS